MNPVSSVIIPVITGSGAPDNAIGRDNQYYYDGLNGMMYGPKAGGVWPAGVRLQDNVTQGTGVGQLLYWDGTKWATAASNRISWDAINSRLGLWTSTPSGVLTIDQGAGGSRLIPLIDLRNTSPIIKLTAYRTVGTLFVFDFTQFFFQNDVTVANLINLGVYGNNNIGGTPTLLYFYIGNTYLDNAFRVYPDKNIYMAGKAGINNTSPARRIDIIDNAAPQIRIGYSSTVYEERQVDSNGDLTVYQTGDEIFHSGQSSTQKRTIFSVKRTMPVSTDASRTGLVEVYVNDYGGSRKAIAFGANGTESVLGFHGVTPIVKQNHIADAETAADDTELRAKLNDAVGKLNSVLALLESYGLTKTS